MFFISLLHMFTDEYFTMGEHGIVDQQVLVTVFYLASGLSGFTKLLHDICDTHRLLLYVLKPPLLV